MKYLRIWIYNFGIILGASSVGVSAFLVIAFSMKWLAETLSPIAVVIVVILIFIGVLTTIITPKK